MNKVRLELLDRKHFNKIVEWRNKSRVYNSFFTRAVASVELQEIWFNQHTGRDDEENFVACSDEEIKFNVAPSVIVTTYIGAVSLYDINRTGKRAEFGRFYIGEDDYLGHGYGEQILRTILDYGFNTLNLEEIYLFVRLDNWVIKLYNKVGFTNDGIVPISGGVVASAFKMSLRKENYCGNN